MHRKVLFLCLALIICISCLCSPASALRRISPTHTSAPTSEIQNQTSTTLAPTDLAAATDLPPEPTETDDDSSAPFLVLSTADSLLLADENGENLHPLLSDTVIAQPLYQLIQPSGHLMAVIQKTNQEYNLVLVDLSTGADQQIAFLTQDQPIDTIGTAPFEALRAITEQPSIAWSPDGTKLAYIASQTDSNADLFIYDVPHRKSTLVENDPSQSSQPMWNPTGDWLVFVTIDTFGTGAGSAMNSLWGYRVEAGRLTRLSDLTSSSGEDLLGWSNEDTLVLNSWNPMCGKNALRRINLSTGKIEMIRKECFTAASVNDEGGILFGTGEHAWLVPADQKKGSVIVDGNIGEITWLPTDCIFKVQRGEMPLLSLDRWGRDKQTAPENGIQDVTMYGAIWAWTDAWGEAPGVWTSGMGLETQKIFEGAAYSPIWTPHNDLLFVSENHLFRGTFLNYTDASPIADLPDTIIDSAWAQFNIY